MICFFFVVIYFFPAVLEIQSYSSKLKRFLGFYSNHFLAYEVKGKRKGKFTGEVSITTKKETSIAFAFLNDRECKELDQTDLFALRLASIVSNSKRATACTLAPKRLNWRGDIPLICQSNRSVIKMNLRNDEEYHLYKKGTDILTRLQKRSLDDLIIVLYLRNTNTRV